MALIDNKKVLIINGYDFTPLVEEGGFSIVRNDVDSAEAGELQDGTLRRDRVIIRPTIEVKILNHKVHITDEIAHEVMKALEPQWLNVSYYDVRLGKDVTRLFYTNNIKCTIMSAKNGKRRWMIDPFTLTAKGVAGDGRANVG